MKKAGTKKVETKGDHYEVMDQTFKTHREALSAAKRILEEHPECDVVEIHSHLKSSIKYFGIAVEWAHVESVKKVYGDMTNWHYEYDIYF